MFFLFKMIKLYKINKIIEVGMEESIWMVEGINDRDDIKVEKMFL